MTDLVDPYDLSDPSDYPAAMKRDADRIRELQKRIGELEADILSWRGKRDDWREAAAQSERDLTAERQRREEAEAAAKNALTFIRFVYRWATDIKTSEAERLSIIQNHPYSREPDKTPGAAYFSRHPSSSGNEPGNGRSE